VPTLNDLVHDRTALGDADVEWLRQLVGDWQMLSDLSFADLVLWAAATDGQWLAVAHVRPTTGSTVFFDDVVGTEVARGRRPQLDRAFDAGVVCREHDPEWTEDVPVREETIPVVRAGRTIAVMSRHTDLSSLRTPSRLEVTYMACADALARMVAEGTFPVAGAPTGSRRGAPRVGDGLIRLDVDGIVVYASPNAVSAFHRLGHGRELIGQSLAEITTPLVRTQGVVDEGLPLVLTGRAPWRCDVDGKGTTLSLRAIPLIHEGQRNGALLLLRDVTELRRRERELLSKDAMIREIHHRVKNNLQTVAALLRLQARRLDGGPARSALNEAVRRVGAIALVHETLSAGYDETVDFDDGRGARPGDRRRGGQPVRVGPHPARRAVRAAAGRGRDRAVARAHRACAERRGARVRRPRRRGLGQRAAARRGPAGIRPARCAGQRQRRGVAGRTDGAERRARHPDRPITRG
jgi:two-component system, sensor histidine kinase PdtaS